MSAPQPKPATSDDEEESDEPDDEVVEEMREQVDDQLDELDEAEPAGDTGPPSGSDPFAGDEDADELDLDLAETNIGEEVGDDDSPFDGVEDADDESRSGAYDGATSTEDDAMGMAGDAMGVAEDLGGGSIETAINEGSARLATVGLPETFIHNGETKQKEDLEDEFVEVFETFRLGAFGEEAADEYLDMEPGEVDPMWGFAASLVLCTVLVVQMRPDGDQLIEKLRNRT